MICMKSEIVLFEIGLFDNYRRHDFGNLLTSIQCLRPVRGLNVTIFQKFSKIVW